MRHKRKLICLGIAVSMLLSSGLSVQANQDLNMAPVLLKDALSLDTSQDDNGDLPIQYVDSLDDIELLQQEQEVITDFMQSDEEVAPPKIGNQVDLAELDGSRSLGQARRSVIDGSFDDYIEIEGGYKAYSIPLPGGAYLQAQLDLPNNADIDYDLFILDKNGVVVAYSQYGTYLNGSEGTVSESTGYITPIDAPTETYYIYIESVAGSSITQPFTIHYSLSALAEIDAFELSALGRSTDNSTEANVVPISYNTVTIPNSSLHSPIDNDWYMIEVPSSRDYDKLALDISTVSSNSVKFDVFINVGGTYHYLKKVNTSQNVLTVTAGTYYIRVSNASPGFDSGDIQNYTLTISPVLRPAGIIITGLVGSESSPYVAYPGFDVRFRSEQSRPVQISGIVYSQAGGNQYYSANTAVTGVYFNPFWYSQSNDYLAFSYGEAVTNASGQFTVTVMPRTVYGMYVEYHMITIQYRDSVEFAAQVTEYPNVMDSEIAWLMRSVYTG